MVLILGVGAWFYARHSGDQAYWVALVNLNQWVASQERGATPQQAQERYKHLPIHRVRDPLLKEMHDLYGKLLINYDDPMPKTERIDPADPEYMKKVMARSEIRKAHQQKLEEKVGPVRDRFFKLLDEGLKKYGPVQNPYQ